jgi:hypothetical protein
MTITTQQQSQNNGRASNMQCIVRAKKDSDTIALKVVDIATGYFVDVFALPEQDSSETPDLVSTFFHPPRCGF